MQDYYEELMRHYRSQKRVGAALFLALSYLSQLARVPWAQAEARTRNMCPFSLCAVLIGHFIFIVNHVP